MKISLCLFLCLFIFAGCWPYSNVKKAICKPRKKSSKVAIDDKLKNAAKESTRELREEAERLKKSYKEYQKEKFSEVK